MKITVQMPLCSTEGARFKSRQEIFFVEFPCCSYIPVGYRNVLRLAPTGQRPAFRWFSDSKPTRGMNQDPGEHWGPLHGCDPTAGLDPSDDFMTFKVLPKRHFKLVTLVTTQNKTGSCHVSGLWVCVGEETFLS